MSRLIHRSKPSEPTFWRTSAKRAASWFLQCFSLSFVSSEDLGGIASLALPRAQEAPGCKWQQKGMNRGMNRGTDFFRPERHQECPRSTKTACVSLRQWPTSASTASDSLQKASSKFQAQQRHPPPSPRVLRQAAPPRHSTTDATDNSSTRTSAGLLYNSIHWHFPLKIASRDRGG